jgi:hypothetical protein
LFGERRLIYFIWGNNIWPIRVYHVPACFLLKGKIMTPPETPTTTTTFRYLVLTIVPKKCNPGSERENGLGRKRQKMDWGVGQACCCC